MATTTLYQFTPTVDVNFSFQPTLDGQEYNVVVTWAYFGRRWIINVYDLANNLIVAKPMTGSPDNYNINLIAGYFSTTTLVFRASSSSFEVTS